MAARYLVPALAVAGRAAAQCSASATTTIQNQGDASSLASCTTFSGSIAVATDTVGSIQLDGIQEITGSLVANNVSGLTSISGDALTTISDTFEMTQLTGLTEVNFPDLTTVDTITWTSLNALSGLNLAAGISMAKTVSITDTMLASLTGINLQVVDTLNLISNRFLDQITMSLGNVTTGVTIQANGDTAAVSFPDLIWANTMSLQDLQSLSIPALATMNGSLYFLENNFTSLAAPNLTSVGGSLVITGNSNLANLSMPELKTIEQAFVISQNPDLTTVDQFGALSTIYGTLNFTGAFTSVLLPAITDIEGAFTLSSTDTTGAIDKDCDTFKGESGRSSAIKVISVCQGNDQNAVSENGTTTPTSSSSGSSSTTSKGAASNLVITGTTGLLGVVAAIFGML